MKEIDRDQLLHKTHSVYKRVMLASLRAIELSDGAVNLTGDKPEAKTINAALKEIAEGRIEYKVKEKK